MSANKIKYGLKNAHVAKLTKTTTAGVTTYTYGTPKALPGAVNLSLDAQGESEPFYADDTVYYRSQNNQGYNGDLELALVPDWFREEILGETQDDNNVLVERNTSVEPVYFALMFEFQGDVRATRHVLYNCTASRPSMEAATKEDSVTPATETLTISADPREDGLVKARTGENTSQATYNAWYSSVYEPSTTAEYAALSALAITGVTLSPTFAAGTTAYTAATTDATNVVSATGADGATVAITVNGSAHTSGSAATWTTGSNTVTVTASKTGKTSRTYTITVTKSSE